MLSTSAEARIATEYFTPMLLCAKPKSIDSSRWFLKCLSNDQTSFTGFTSLVEVGERFGYSKPIRLTSAAAFVEPFALAQASNPQRLCDIRDRIASLDSTATQEIDALSSEAEALVPVSGRSKGKSPIFFYGIADTPFSLPRSVNERMEKALEIIYDAFSAEAELRRGERRRNILTGSIDFMVEGDTIYVIDIGTPAVGYIADILAGSVSTGREPQTGIEKIAQGIPGNAIVYENQRTRDLGFFALESTYLAQELERNGIAVQRAEGEGEAEVEGVSLPDETFDFVTRYQPIRQKIFAETGDRLRDIDVRTPTQESLLPDDLELARFFDKAPNHYGLVIKKRPLFTEYLFGDGYFKPLVTPLWSRELRSDRNRRLLVEQCVQSTVPISVIGEREGQRSCEIRMYFTAP